jgi:hypothetical protein
MSIVDRTYPVEVPEIGRFIFRKRRVPDQVKIESIADRMTDGPVEDAELRHIAMAWATLKTLTIEAPKGWDVEDIDPLEAADLDKMWKVWGALRKQEDTFRGGARKDSPDTGPAAS